MRPALRAAMTCGPNSLLGWLRSSPTARMLRGSASKAGWRLAFMRELRQHVLLDSFGECAHNNDSCPKSGKRKCDKVVMAGAYSFVFAFENTEESHYVTEKVYTGLRSGAVPIYKGAPEVLQHVPMTRGGSPSIILADSFSTPRALAEHLQSLLADKRAYDAYHDWDLPGFAKAETVAQCPWQCRVCEWVAGKRDAGAVS